MQRFVYILLPVIVLEALTPASHIEPACTADVDIVLKSMDGVLLGAHLQYLSAWTDAFPMPDNVLTLARTEVVDLPENAATLEIVLKFVHPQRPPAVDTISDDLLILIAEAVEKYGVYPGMEVCRLRMKFVHLYFVVGYAD